MRAPTAPLLPASSWAHVTTRRLREPQVLWSSSDAAAGGFDPQNIYCCPKDYEATNSYTQETREEGADRYGGIGVGTAGGSGRCSSYNGMQTKGVGITPLVGPTADRVHSSGTLTLTEAATEAVFAGVYQAALPFGAVPTYAVVITGGRYMLESGIESENRREPVLRALTFRPLVARPAHFMRNVLHPPARRSAGQQAKGWTLDSIRTAQSQALLSKNLRQCLNLTTPLDDNVGTLDAGMRELVRRYAWQCAAGFAKRLPHGSLGCSNISLNGSYMDFGRSNFTPAYRRLCWIGQDPWNEAGMPLNTLLTLRQQLGKYHLGSDDSKVISCEEITAHYANVLQERLAVEMARMAGLTESWAASCPQELLASWLQSMRSIWTSGANEQFQTYRRLLRDGQPPPAPRMRGRYDLNIVLTAAAPHSDPSAIDAAVRPHLGDEKLRARFVTTAAEVRAWLRLRTGAPPAALDGYLGRQAARKNKYLHLLCREGNDQLASLLELERDGDVTRVGAAIDAALQQASHGLSDVCPTLPGTDGEEQLRVVAGLGHPHSSAAPGAKDRTTTPVT